jgi:hypothetical protein
MLPILPEIGKLADVLYMRWTCSLSLDATRFNGTI